MVFIRASAFFYALTRFSSAITISIQFANSISTMYLSTKLHIISTAIAVQRMKLKRVLLMHLFNNDAADAQSSVGVS